MSDSLDVLLAALDLPLDPESEPDALILAVHERQRILERVASFDARTLGEHERSALRDRLEVVRARDADVVARLLDRRDSIGEALGNMARARDAVRGYRPADNDGPRTQHVRRA